MTDDELRKRLLRQQALEAILIAAAVAFVSYLLWPQFVSVVKQGSLTLYAGKVGPKVPVVLSVTEFPLAVVGVLLVHLVFFAFVVLVLAPPLYHVIRLGAPRLALPRVPFWSRSRRVQWVLFGALPMLLAVGGTLAMAQYILTTLP